MHNDTAFVDYFSAELSKFRGKFNLVKVAHDPPLCIHARVASWEGQKAADQPNAASLFKMDDLFGDLPPPSKMKIGFSPISWFLGYILFNVVIFCVFQRVKVTIRLQQEVCMMIFQLRKVEKIKENLRMVIAMNYQTKDLPRVR